MKKPMIILPLDTYASGELLLEEAQMFFTDPDVNKLVSHVKLNDGVHQPDLGGPTLIVLLLECLAKLGSKAKIFLDLKILDVSATLVNVLKKYLNEGYLPDILTVSSNCSVEGIMKLRRLLPGVKLAMVSALTDIPREEFMVRFGKTPEIHILNDLVNIREIYKKKISADKDWKSSTEPFDLIVCSPLELGFLKHNLKKLSDLGGDYGFIVPGIRDEWMKKPEEHQKRTTGIREALENGATYVVMGAQLRDGNPFLNISPEESRAKTFAEISASNYGIIVKGNPLETLKNCRGFYESPRDQGDDYIGPVVGYAKKYTNAAGELKNMVGFIYLNFAKAEQDPEVRKYFATEIAKLIIGFKLPKTRMVIMGAPMGGLFLAADIGRSLKVHSIFAEKEVTVAADSDNNVREESRLVIARHDLNPGDEVILVEDVVNNFSTTNKMKELIEERGAKLIAIACAFNRSGQYFFEHIPVMSACVVSLNQYEQEDPAVADLIAAGKFVLKPKADWDKLAQAMEAGGISE